MTIPREVEICKRSRKLQKYTTWQRGELVEERRNPFTPSFGMVPPFLAGRDRLLREMARAFEDGPGFSAM